MFDKSRAFHLKTIALLFTIGFLGLFVCFAVERVFFSGDDVKIPLGFRCVEIVIGGIWFFTLMVIVPVQILYFHRKNRDNASLEKVKIRDFAGVLFGACNPDAKLPKWVSVPILVFLWLLAAVFVLVVVLCVIARCIGPSSV